MQHIQSEYFNYRNREGLKVSHISPCHHRGNRRELHLCLLLREPQGVGDAFRDLPSSTVIEGGGDGGSGCHSEDWVSSGELLMGQPDPHRDDHLVPLVSGLDFLDHLTGL